MPHSRSASQSGVSQSFEMERKYSVPSNPDSRSQMLSGAASEDLHAWSIYRQNLNSDFTDSALGSTDKSPLPYGNFQLRDTTVQSILSHPRYGPKSALGSNMYTYLKFGLPRVFPPNHNGSNRSTTPQQFNRGVVSTTNRPHLRAPKHAPRGLRDGSSGYDSSDNETMHQYKQNRKYRSDPDFRMQNVHPSYHQQHPQQHPQNQQHHHQQHQQQQHHQHQPQQQHIGPPHGGYPLPGMRPVTMSRPGSGNQNQWSRNKSISEANLLSAEMYSRHPGSNINNRRNSVADFGQDMVDNSVISHPIARPMSKTGSEISMMHSRRGGTSVIRGDYIHGQELGPTFVYPHLQVRSLEVTSPTNKRMLLLQNVSFEIRGGEIMAVMATSEVEGTGLLDTIAGLRNPVGGDIILNGQHITKSILKSRVAYAQNDSHLCREMTAQQTLKFHYDLKKPTEKLDHLKIDAMDRINVLIEDLGLEQVRNTKVENMTTSEKRRLNVGCHLLLDTDIVALDQPTRGMDIFDTFFLVEYLRQWATGGSGNALGRIVILTLHPPTYEIFTMLSRVVLLSAGRTMYSGKRRDMLAYFSMVEYPCPSFKNPSDYYLDLVTLDDLSAEAMLESSQRIEQLADVFRRKQEPLSDPGPPTTLPLTVRNTNCFRQGWVLFTKSMFYSQPNTFIKWTSLFVIAATISIVIGAIFWDVPNSDAQLILNDRLGYHFTVMSLAVWPVLIALTYSEIRTNKQTVQRDIKDGLYGRFTYIFVKTFLNILPSIFIWLVYLVPCYSMSGLYMQGPNNNHGFYIYIGYMLLYLCCLQSLITGFAYLIPWSTTSTLLSAGMLAVTWFVSGYTVHPRDFPIEADWLQYISPASWLLPTLATREYTDEAISSSAVTTLCRNKQVQHQDIIVQLPCPPPNGMQIMTSFGFQHSNSDNIFFNYPAIAMAVFYCIFFILACIGFMINCCNQKSNKRRHTDSNKP